MLPDQKLKNVLIVDDAAKTREVLMRNLVKYNFNVFTASSVTEAIQTLDLVDFDLVITDYKMQAHDGLELIKYIHNKFIGTGIIMLTGYSTIEIAKKAIQTGADDFMGKPFTEAELVSTIEKTLEKSFLRKKISSEIHMKDDLSIH